MTVSFAEARMLLMPPPPHPASYNLNDIQAHCGVQFTPEQRAALQDIPFSEDVLKACAGTHMLFPTPSLSLLQIRDIIHPDLFYDKSDGWYAEEKETFSRAPIPVQWNLLRMAPIPESFNKSWDEQCSLLTEGEEVPSSAVVTVATILHFLATGQRLFERCYVRTADRGSDDDRFSVGDFDADGLSVRSYWDGHRTPRLGLAASRKF